MILGKKQNEDDDEFNEYVCYERTERKKKYGEDSIIRGFTSF